MGALGNGETQRKERKDLTASWRFPDFLLKIDPSIADIMSTTDEVRFSEGRLTTVKSGLESWKEVVIRLDSVLGWVWYWDPTLLTFIAFLGLMITLLDYLGPKITSQVFGNNWNLSKEQKYDQVCGDIVSGIENVEDAFRYMREARGKKPMIHFVVTCLSLLALAWFGNKINNFFLAYLLTMGLVMLPGLQRKGLLQKHMTLLSAKFTELTKGKDAFVKKVE